jgi:hypothetical protein
VTGAAPSPNFIIGGAPRSGTTLLCHALDRHPGIFLAKPFVPEPKVLVLAGRDDATALADYARYFSGAPAGRLLGEKSSSCLESEAVCERIARLLPDTRMVFLVREPVARAYSNYLWSRRNGFETLDFETGIAREPTRPDPMPPSRAHTRPFDYLSRGRYATFARWYYDRLGLERVGFFLYEEFIAEPVRVLGDIQRFVGAPRLDLDIDPGRWVNSARETGDPIDPDVECRLRERMEPEVHRFARISGLDLSVWGYGACRG